MNTISLKFIIRKDCIRSNGLCSICLRTHCNKEQHREKLPISICPDNWDDIRQGVSNKEYEHFDKNKMQVFYEAQAKLYISDC